MLNFRLRKDLAELLSPWSIYDVTCLVPGISWSLNVITPPKILIYLTDTSRREEERRTNYVQYYMLWTSVYLLFWFSGQRYDPFFFPFKFYTDDGRWCIYYDTLVRYGEEFENCNVPQVKPAIVLSIAHSAVILLLYISVKWNTIWNEILYEIPWKKWEKNNLTL